MANAEVSNARTTIGAGGLHTPQEPTLDSFSQAQEDKCEDAPSLPSVRTVQTHSPPASPEFRPDVTVVQAQDLPLFDGPGHDSQQADAPLFDSDGAGLLVGEATATTPGKVRKAEKSAQKDDWRQTLEKRLEGRTNLGTIIGPTVYIHPSPEGAWAYWNARMQEVYRIRAAQLPKPSKTPVAVPRDAETARQLRLVDQSAKVTKNRSPTKAAAKPIAAAMATPSRAASPAEGAEVQKPLRRSRTPKAKVHDNLIDDGTEKRHKRAPPSKQTASKEEDVRWREMPNFAPTLPALEYETSYKVSWKQGSCLDNTTEPDFDELSPAEQEACSVLRLKPVQWLANKRRIFAMKLQAVKDGEKFTKTKAQMASNIDVNKTTQMFEAFERMGWMENHWFEPFL